MRTDLCKMARMLQLSPDGHKVGTKRRLPTNLGKRWKTLKPPEGTAKLQTETLRKHPLWAAGIPVASGVRIISANGGQAPDPNARASRRLTRPHVESRGRAYLPIIPVDESADDQPVDICRASGSRGKASHSVPTMAGACAASDAIGNKRAETRRRVRRRARSFRSANSTAAARRGR